jgi:hypothetical protein
VHLAAAQTGIHSVGVGPNKRVLSSGVRLLQNQQSDNVQCENSVLTSSLQGGP